MSYGRRKTKPKLKLVVHKARKTDYLAATLTVLGVGAVLGLLGWLALNA